MDPYEEYMRSLRPDLYGPTSSAPATGAPTGRLSTLAKVGTGVGVAGDVLGGAASLYGTYKALDAAKDERDYQRQRDQQADYLNTQDRLERRRKTGRNEMLENADYSGDFLDNLMNMYRQYNGGYFNLHG
jgi:rRNA processing protein Gar1